MPKLLDRNAYVIWEQKGSKSTFQRLNERVRGILAKHQPPELPPGVTQKIQSILEVAERRVSRN